MLGKLSYGIKKVLDLGTFGPQLARGANQRKKFQRSDETFSINKLLFSENENGMFLDATDVNLNWRKNLLTYSEQFENAGWTKTSGFIQTNLLTYSEQFDNAVWAKTNVNVFGFDPATATQGAELVTNGDFSVGTGWATGGAWVISGGNASITASTTILSQSATTAVAGRWYKVVYTILSISAGSVRIEFGGVNGTTRTAAGTYTQYFLATNTNGIVFQPLTTLTASIDDVSIKELTGGLITAPDGTTTADLLYPSTSGTIRWIYQTLTAASAVYTRSVYAKAQNKSIVYIDATGTGTVIAYFNLSSGTVGTVPAGYTATITAAGNGWYRCTLTNSTATAYSFSGVYGVADADGSTTVTANNIDGIYLWGAQFVQGAVPGDYRATTSAALPVLYEFPDSTLTAQVFSATATNAQLDKAIQATTGGISYPATNVTVSVWAKRKTGTGTVQLLHPGGGSPLVMDVTNEWKRFEVTGTGYNTYFLARIVLSTSGDEIFVSKWQVEYGTVATDYQKITDGVVDYYNVDSQPVLFQNSSGTLPVSAVEQQVGLILDKSRGLAVSATDSLGGNGYFSNPAYWQDVNGVSTISGGQLSFNGSATLGGVWSNANNPLTIGNFYQVTFDVLSISSGGVRVWLGLGTPTYTATTIGTHTFLAACIGDRQVRIYNNGTATTAIVDNVVIREIAGNHAYQSTTNSCPFLRARYNLLTYSEQFSNAAWSPTNVTLASGVSDPNGGTSAFTLTATANFGNIAQSGTRVGLFLSSIWIRRRTGSGGVQILSADGQTWVTVTVTSQWTKFEDTKTSTNLGGSGVRLSVSGDAVDIAFADLRNLPSPTPYQRIAAATDYDYDPTKFPAYLDFDGNDDWLVTNPIDFTPTDRASVFATIRKTNDTNQGLIVESSTNAANTFSSYGKFAVTTGGSGRQKYTYGLTGSSGRNLLPYTNNFENAEWTKTNLFVQTNLLTYSNDFDNPAWFPVAASVVPKTDPGPFDGSSFASRLVGNGLTDVHFCRQIVTTTGTDLHTASVYVKQGTDRYCYFTVLGRSVTDDKGDLTFFDLQTGTKSGSANSSITSVGNNWYRITQTSQSYPSSTQIEFRLGMANASGTQTSNASGYILTWGGQLVRGANTAGNYRATTSAALPSLYTGPDNSNTATKLIASGAGYIEKAVQSLTVPQSSSIYAKQGEARYIAGYIGNGAGFAAMAAYDLQTGTVAISAAHPVFLNIAPTIQSIGSGWYRCGLRVGDYSGTYIIRWYTSTTLPTISGYALSNISGDGSSGIYAWGASLEKAVETPSPYALPFYTEYTSETHPSLNTDVISVNYDLTSNAISQQIRPRVDGTLPTLTYGDVETAGVGQFSNSPIYIGRRGGTSLPFNGRMYSLIVRDRETPEATRFQVEKLLAAQSSSSVAIVEPWSPAKLFDANTAGVWYDISAIAPQLAWRRNLLSYTEQFDNAFWTKTGAFIQTNLLKFSEQFDNALWIKNGTTVTANQASAPDGTLTADLAVVNNGAQTYVQLSQDLTALTGLSTYTLSASVKKSGASYAVIGWIYSDAIFCAASYNLDTQTLSRSFAGGGFAIISSSITSQGDDWYRITLTVTTPSTGAFSRSPAVFPRVTPWTTGRPDVTDTGNGTSGIYIWGAQLVQGAVAGDYRATTSATLPILYTDPLGGLTAQRLSEDTSTGAHQVLVNAGNYSGLLSYSVFVKKSGTGSTRYACLQSNTQNNTECAIFVDLDTGTITQSIINSSAIGNVTVTSASNGWWRIKFDGLKNNGISARFIVSMSNTATGNAIGATSGKSYTGDGTGGILVWGAQLERSGATTYQKIVTPATTMYDYVPTPIYHQDTSTPVFAAEQPVGIFIDSTIGTIGNELVGATWTCSDATWSQSGSTLTAVNGTSFSCYQLLVTIGRMYRVQFEVFDYISGTLSVRVGNSTEIAISSIGNNIFTGYGLAAGDTFFYFMGNGTFNGKVRNISVKEVPGNHAYQTATTSARPLLRSRYNLLTYSEEFDNAGWSKLGTVPVVTPNATTAPDGTFTADSIYFPATGSSNRIQQVVSPGPLCTVSIWLRGSVGGEQIQIWNGWSSINQTVTLTTSWQRFVFSESVVNGSSGIYLYAITSTPTIFAWGAQVVTGPSPLPYQRIAAATDYDFNPNNFPPYLVFDGIDDRLIINNTSLFNAANGGALVFAGGQPLNNPNRVMMGWTTDSGGVPRIDIRSGSILGVHLSGAGKRQAAHATTLADVGVFNSTSNFVGAVIANWSANTLTARLNGQLIETSNFVSAGNTDNISSYAARIGCLGNITDSSFYNGRMYGALAANRAFTDAEIADVEAYYLNSRMPTISSINYLVDDSGNILVDEFNYNPTVNDITYQ